jgi:hypothetical protein
VELRHSKSVALVFFFLSGYSASAGISSTDYAIHQDYISIRALGMGNAFTAVADDTAAIFYNPAALAYRKERELKLSLGAVMDTKVGKLNNDIKNANGQSTQSAKIDAITSLLDSHYGDYYSARATLGAMYAWPKWEIAFVPADLSLDMSIHQGVGPMLNVNGYLDSTLAMATGRELHWAKGHQLAWGTTLKAVHRVYAGQTILAADLVQGSKVFQAKDADEGITFDADVGTLWTPPTPRLLKYMKPTFAFVGRNLIDYGFTTNFHMVDPHSGEPPKLGRRFDVGSRWDLPKFWVFDPHIMIDERDMGDPNFTARKGFHVGAELFWQMFHWWKGHWSVGVNQGYLSLGLGAKLAWFQFNLATYAEEVGTASVPNQSRRYAAELALDF